ncbi:MAG: PAS domain-containing sensor histidine kinase [Saprospiraceae bacterium]
MTHRRLLIYLVILHLLVLAGGVWLLREQPYVLISLEVVTVVSFLVGLSIWRKLHTTQRMLHDGTAALRDQDYSLRLSEVGVRDVDELIEVYNGLLEKIRTERIDNQRQQFFLTLLIESTTLGVITMNYDGFIDSINSWGREQLGLMKSGPIPEQLHEIDHPLATALSELREEEKSLIRLSNNQRYRCESASFIDRGFSRRFVVINNISGELTDAEVAAYGQVIRMMAHEVNNTTAATRSMLQSLMDTDDLDDTTFRQIVSDYLPLIAERGESLNDFMSRFADVVRLPDPELATVDLDLLLDKQAAIAKPVCEALNIDIQLSLKPAKIQGDAALLQQVIINALTNARESISESGGTIKIECQPGGFAIGDNGAGISEEASTQLFTPFFSTKPTGQGIGLTLTRDVLERHHATYSLATQEDGWTWLRVEF